MSLEEDHDLFDLLLLFPGARDGLRADFANAGHFTQAVRGGFDHLQDLQSKMIDNAAGGHRANAAHQPAAQVFAQPLNRGRVMHAKRAHLELASILRVAGPYAFQVQQLAYIDAREGANHGDFVGFAFGDQAGNGITVLFVLECQPLQRTFQVLQLGWGAGCSLLFF